MSADRDKKRFVITPEELRSARVDDKLAQQQSFGMPTEAGPDEPSAWYYKSWFVLMLAGGLGALLAWAIIEPFFEDQLVLEGIVEEYDPEARLLGVSELQGKITVSGTPVWLLTEYGRMKQSGGDWGTLDRGAIRKGLPLRVNGELIPDGTGALLAMEVEVLPEGTVPVDHGDLESQAFGNMFGGLAMFPLVAALVGLAIGCADGLVSRAYGRALVCGLVGLGMGVGVGIVSTLVGGFAYGILTGIAQGMDSSPDPFKMSTGAFLVQVMGRGLAWAIVGIAAGLGQGVALRSSKLVLNGIVGALLGGLLGGLLFDPINYVVGGGQFAGSAASSRAIGVVVIGLAVGLMIGIVELIARESWLKMLAGPLAGKEFVLYRDPTTIGSSPKREVYLFKDPDVEPVHAKIHRAGEGYEIEDQKTPSGTFVNGRKVSRQRLNTHDQIRIGSTVLLFTMKEE